LKRWLVLLLVCLAVSSMPSFRGDPISVSEQSLKIIADANSFQGPDPWKVGPSDYLWRKLVASGQEGSLDLSPSEENISLNMNYLGSGRYEIVRSSSRRDYLESYVDMNLFYIYKDPRSGGGSDSNHLGDRAGRSPAGIEGAIVRSDQDMRQSLDALKPNISSHEVNRYGESSYASSEDNLARLYGSYGEGKARESPDPWALFQTKTSFEDYGISRLGQSSLKGTDSEQIRRGHKNYALVVGINGYADRRGLHTCINDANSIASILNAYGYEVIKLTDETRDKPTKHNILEGALSEICTKQDRGNVIIYFSGHAFKDPSGNFYLVPQDGDGDGSSYIGAEDIDRYIKNLKNLALIIDACNSGGFNGVVGEGQVALLSSEADQLSNEEWPGYLSVFTSQLCEAIKEEHQKNKEVVLQRCFYIARNNTIQWSDRHLLRQTPEIRDRTSGAFYLN